jgi:hypothetical protein
MLTTLYIKDWITEALTNPAEGFFPQTPRGCRNTTISLGLSKKAARK